MNGLGAVSSSLADAVTTVTNLGPTISQTIYTWGVWAATVLAFALSIQLAITSVLAFVRYINS